MSFRRNRDVDRTSTALLASAIVIVGGGLACGFIIILFAEEPRELIKWVLGVSAGLIIVSWLLRDRPSTNLNTGKFLWLIQKNQKQDAPIYIPERREPDREIVREQDEVIEPPTVEQIRSLKQENAAQSWSPTTAAMREVAAKKSQQSQPAHLKGKPRRSR